MNEATDEDDDLSPEQIAEVEAKMREIAARPVPLVERVIALLQLDIVDDEFVEDLIDATLLAGPTPAGDDVWEAWGAMGLWTGVDRRPSGENWTRANRDAFTRGWDRARAELPHGEEAAQAILGEES